MDKGKWKRAMETVEDIVWWVGGSLAITAFFVCLSLLGTMALIGKWAISIDLLTQMFR